MGRMASQEERPLEGLSFQERFEVRRAVYGGRAVWDPKLASAAVALARRLEGRPRRWSQPWFRSFLLDSFDVPIFVLVCVGLLVIWPSLITVGILAGGFLLTASMSRRRRRRKAKQAEAANRQLLEAGAGVSLYSGNGFFRGAPPYPWWQWVLLTIWTGVGTFAYFALITRFRLLKSKESCGRSQFLLQRSRRGGSSNGGSALRVAPPSHRPSSGRASSHMKSPPDLATAQAASRTPPAGYNSDNEASRADPARGPRRYPQAHGNSRKAMYKTPCSRGESPPIPA
jgi:hypothetical protein